MLIHLKLTIWGLVVAISMDIDAPGKADNFQLAAKFLHQDSNSPSITTGPRLICYMCVGRILFGCLFSGFLCSTPGFQRPDSVSEPFRAQSKTRWQAKPGFKV